MRLNLLLLKKVISERKRCKIFNVIKKTTTTKKCVYVIFPTNASCNNSKELFWFFTAAIDCSVRPATCISPTYCASPLHVSVTVHNIFCSSSIMHQRSYRWMDFLSHHHYHHHRRHLSLNSEGCWGTTDNFATSFLRFPLFSSTLWDFANSRPVHSLMLSSHLPLPVLYSSPFRCVLHDGCGQT